MAVSWCSACLRTPKMITANSKALWVLLSREFMWLVFAGRIIASPLTFWLMGNWLSAYDYRINIGAWVFGVAALVAITIALIRGKCPGNKNFDKKPRWQPEVRIAISFLAR